MRKFKSLQKSIGEPATPMTAGNWTLDEWGAAEARVFALRVLYNQDSLSAIYKDIAINLQAQLTRQEAKSGCAPPEVKK